MPFMHCFSGNTPSVAVASGGILACGEYVRTYLPACRTEPTFIGPDSVPAKPTNLHRGRRRRYIGAGGRGEGGGREGQEVGEGGRGKEGGAGRGRMEGQEGQKGGAGERGQGGRGRREWMEESTHMIRVIT